MDMPDRNGNVGLPHTSYLGERKPMHCLHCGTTQPTRGFKVGEKNVTACATCGTVLLTLGPISERA